MDDTSPSLLQRMQGPRDDAAWQRFVDLYTPLVHHWLRQRCRLEPADADDLTQTVMAAIVAALPGFEHNQHVGAFRNWLRTITLHRLRDFWRSRQGRPQASGDSAIVEVLEQWADPDSELSKIWQRDHDQFVMSQAMEVIEHDFQTSTWQAFQRCVVDGQAASDVAAELGLTSNAVLVAKSRVLRRLRQELDGFAQI